MISVNGVELGGSSGSVASSDITDSTSVGRSVLTATDAAAARTAIGVSGVSAGAIADLSNGGVPTNAFHLIEGSGAFADHGSAPATLTETGAFRRGRLGPRALVPGVWPPVSPAGTSLSFPAWLGSDQAFSLGLTIRGLGATNPSGKIIQTGWDDYPIHEVVWVDPTHVRVILHHASSGPQSGPLIAVDPTKPLRILYTYVYCSPRLYVNGVGTDCGGACPFTNSGSNNVAALIEAAGFAANDLEFWSGVTLTADQAVADYERFAQAFAVSPPVSPTALLGSSTGWTLAPAAGGSATISGGSLVLSVPSGSNSASSVGAYSGAIPAAGRWRMQWRQTFASADAQAGVYMRFWLDWDGALGAWDRVQQIPDGTLTGTDQAGATLVYPVVVPVDGTMWVRVEVDGKTTRVWTGIGSGDTEPSVWTFRGSADNASHVGYPSPASFFYNVGIEGGGTSTSDQTLTIRDLALTAMD